MTYFCPTKNNPSCDWLEDRPTQPCTVCVCFQKNTSSVTEEGAAMSVSQITPTLFLGGADAPLNTALVSQKGITLIVNATLSHACPTYPGVEFVRVPVSDLPSARLADYFDRVAERIHGNRAGGTLVHCVAGMSRSPALVMAYLMRFQGVTLRQAHRWVQESRPFVRLNAGFWDQLLQYERRLYGKNTVTVAAAAMTPSPLRSRGATRSMLMPTQSPLMTQLPPMSPLLNAASPVINRTQVTAAFNRSRRTTKSNSLNV